MDWLKENHKITYFSQSPIAKWHRWTHQSFSILCFENDPTSSRHHVVLGMSYGCCMLRDSKLLFHKAGVTAHMDIATSRVGGADNILFISNWQHMNEGHILEWQIIAIYNVTLHTPVGQWIASAILDVLTYYQQHIKRPPFCRRSTSNAELQWNFHCS